MSSVILAVAFSLAALALSIVAVRRVLAARIRWERDGSRTPGLLRGAWAALVFCCGLTAGLLVANAAYHLITRGLEGAIEGSLCSRMAFYTAAFGWLLAWWRPRLHIRWPWRRSAGPLALPPAPHDTARSEDEPPPAP